MTLIYIHGSFIRAEYMFERNINNLKTLNSLGIKQIFALATYFFLVFWSNIGFQSSVMIYAFIDKLWF